uniref:Uncharacterized protein n=1 Tax=Oryza rufipogon TaxID=4529 RepID=A0A0E0N9H2_ORYRU
MESPSSSPLRHPLPGLRAAAEFRASAKSHRVVEIHGEPPEHERIGLRVLLRRQSSSPPRRHQPLRASASHLQSTIDETLLQLKFDPKEFARCNKLMETYNVLGQEWTFTKLKEQTKYLFDSLIVLVESFHEAGYCFSQISTSTVLVTSSWKFVLLEGCFALNNWSVEGGCFALNNWSVEGVKKYYRYIAVLFRKLLSESMGEETIHEFIRKILLSEEKDKARQLKLEGCFALNNWSVEGVRKDYRDIAVLFRKLLSESMGEETVHPPDFGMLLSLMEKDGFRNKYLIGTHVSLLPDDNINIAYMKIHEFIRKILLAEEKDKARQLKLGITRYSTISTRIRRRIPYKNIWLTKARSNSFMTAFLEQNERNMELGGTDFELLDTIRHFVCHRLDLLKLGFRYKANEVDRMWYAEFPTLLAELQLALFLVGRLEELELEKNFMNRKPMRPKVSSHDFELLDTIRHFVCHRLDLPKLGFRYKANEVDRMWYAEFPTLLAELQLALFLVDRLEELELEKNFMNRKPMRPKNLTRSSTDKDEVTKACLWKDDS